MGPRVHSKLVTDEFLSKALLARKGKVHSAKKVVKSYLVSNIIANIFITRLLTMIDFPKEWYQIINGGKPLQISDVRGTIEQKLIFIPQNAT